MHATSLSKGMHARVLTPHLSVQAESARFCVRPFLQSHNDEEPEALRSPVQRLSQDHLVRATIQQNGVIREEVQNTYPLPPPPSIFAEAAQ